MVKNLSRWLSSFINFISDNIHTILLLTGVALIDLAAYFICLIAALIVTGVSLITLAMLMSHEDDKAARKAVRR